MKYLKIGRYDLYASAIITFAALLRIILIALNWPSTNSDETTMGIMALHIAYRGEHPALFYGQNYMGSLEAYLAALFFHLFGGPSLFALRLPIVLLVTLFFISIYLLTSLLYSKPLALVTLSLLSIGSIPYLTRQIIATGGSSETLLFGSLAFLFGTWLALTYRRTTSLQTKFQRLAGYFCWGLVIGLALWSDMIVVPFLGMAGLFLLVFCWRDLLWAWLAVLLGIATGMIPSLAYSLKYSLNPINVMLGLFIGTSSPAPHTLPGILHGFYQTIVVSIPTATGNPFCPVQEVTILSDNTPRTPVCEALRGVWGAGYLVLLLVALVLTLVTLWQLRSHFKMLGDQNPQRQLIIRHTCRLAMLAAGVLSIAAYTISSAPVDWPAFHARYLITLLFITPAIINPFWNAICKFREQGISARIKAVASSFTLALIACILLFGTFTAFSEVPPAQANYQQRADLINNLVKIGATHIYADYWACNNIAFASNERVICGVLNGLLKPSHNRVPGYYAIVSSDPHTAYVYTPATFVSAALHMIQQNHKAYRRYVFDGYIVYQPIS